MLLWSNLLKLRHFATMLLTFCFTWFLCLCFGVSSSPPSLFYTLFPFFTFFCFTHSWSLLNINQKAKVWNLICFTFNSLREITTNPDEKDWKPQRIVSSWTFCSCCCCIEDPECTWYHFRCKFHGSNPLSSPTSNSPAVDRRTDKEKTSARMDINQTGMENSREGWEKNIANLGRL